MISSYLKSLRKHVGHELILMPSVAVLIWDKDWRLLLVKNKDTGFWQTVGGSIDPDESPEEAAVREAKEETNTTVSLTGIRSVAGGRGFRLTYPNGDKVAYVSVIYDATITDGTIKADDEETSDVQWFDKDDLATLELDDFNKSILAKANVL